MALLFAETVQLSVVICPVVIAGCKAASNLLPPYPRQSL